VTIIVKKIWFVNLKFYFLGDAFLNNVDDTAEYRMSKRLSLLTEKCRFYSDPFRPESSAVSAPPQSLGVEVVYLHGRRSTKTSKIKTSKIETSKIEKSNVASVCIPHKVGSYSWGQFARNLSNPSRKSVSSWLDLDWKTRAEKSLRVVVVRHPLTR
jgi:hypothetical protein